MCEISDVNIKDFCSGREQTGGCQRGGGGAGGKNAKGLGSTGGQSRSSPREAQHSTGVQSVTSCNDGARCQVGTGSIRGSTS